MVLIPFSFLLLDLYSSLWIFIAKLLVQISAHRLAMPLTFRKMDHKGSGFLQVLCTVVVTTGLGQLGIGHPQRRDRSESSSSKTFTLNEASFYSSG